MTPTLDEQIAACEKVCSMATLDNSPNVAMHCAILANLRALRDAQKDAERYQKIKRLAKCDRKKSGLVINKAYLDPMISFRYWCKPDELDAAIDAARSGHE